jgi:hypothetical protein
MRAGSPLIPRQSETRLRLPEAGFLFLGLSPAARGGETASRRSETQRWRVPHREEGGSWGKHGFPHVTAPSYPGNLKPVCGYPRRVSSF